MEKESSLPKENRVIWLKVKVDDNFVDPEDENTAQSFVEMNKKKRKSTDRDDDSKPKLKKLKKKEYSLDNSTQENTNAGEKKRIEFSQGKKNIEGSTGQPGHNASLDFSEGTDKAQYGKTGKANKMSYLKEKVKGEVNEEEQYFNKDSSDDDDEKDEDYAENSNDEVGDDIDDTDNVASKKKSKGSFVEATKRSPLHSKSRSTNIKKSGLIMNDSEQTQFLQCEHLFLEDMAHLCKAVEEGNEKQSLFILDNIEKNLEQITPSFVRESKIGILLKNVRYVFEHIKPNEAVRMKAKALTRSLKDIYAKKGGDSNKFSPRRSKSWKLKNIVDMSQIHRSTSADETVRGKEIEKIEYEEIAAKGHGTEAIDSTLRSSSSAQSQDIGKSSRKSFPLAKALERKPQMVSLTQNFLSEQQNVPTTMTSSDFPKWLTEESVDQRIYEDKRRWTGTQSLLDACDVFKSEKVKPSSIAYALEKAIFEEFGDNMEKYWEKINQIYCAIKGLNTLGTIVPRIEEGKFFRPRSIILIPERFLMQSFKGEAMDI